MAETKTLNDLGSNAGLGTGETQEPIISVQHEKTESGWMVCCYISCLATEAQAITVENVLMDLLCSEEIEKQ